MPFRSTQIHDPVSYLKPKFPDVQLLKSCVVLEPARTQFYGAIEAGIASRSWTDARMELPWLTDEDVAMLLSKMPAIQDEWEYDAVRVESKSSSAKAVVCTLKFVVAPLPCRSRAFCVFQRFLFGCSGRCVRGARSVSGPRRRHAHGVHQGPRAAGVGGV